MSALDAECEALGRDCAAAKLRLDERAPDSLKNAFRAFRGPKRSPSSYFERKWLSLRLSAVKRRMVLDAEVTPAFLQRITPAVCPVTLQPFDTRGKLHSNPSVDRLVNEATYAPGNMGVFSIRANRAKGEKTFEEVAALASAGDSKHGLDGVEWMRLCTLMYGAWSQAVHGGDPYILPLATYPGPAMFCSTSQVVQLLLLRQIARNDWEAATSVWTQVSNGEKEAFLQFALRLRVAIAGEDYPPSAWLHPGVFEAFSAWYQEHRSSIEAFVETQHDKYQAGTDVGAIIERWRHGVRYLASEPCASPEL